MKSLGDVALKGRRVLARVDFNVPMDGERIRSEARIRAALPTARHVLAQGGHLILMSHMGRPSPDDADKKICSLAPVAEALSSLLDKKVRLCSLPPPGEALPVAEGEVALLENSRFWPGELQDDSALGERLAALCDVFVMDAFSVAHRAHASVSAVARCAPTVCAGLSLLAELQALRRALHEPERPLLAIVGGAKISTKLEVLESLASTVDKLALGGGIAHVFLKARGIDIGASLCEEGFADVARRIDDAVEVWLPEDGCVLGADGSVTSKSLDQISQGDDIRDIGERSVASLREIVAAAGTVIWNGPPGAFEDARFAAGSAALAEAVAASDAFSVAGGGDTLAAVERFGVAERLSCLCTGGGAFLEYVAGRSLPALEILTARG